MAKVDNWEQEIDIDDAPESLQEALAKRDSLKRAIGKWYEKRYGRAPYKGFGKEVIRFKDLEEAKKWWQKHGDKVDRTNLPLIQIRHLAPGKVKGTYKKITMSQMKKTGIYNAAAAAKAGKTLYIENIHLKIPGVAEPKFIDAKKRLELIVKQFPSDDDFIYAKIQTPSGRWKNVNPYEIQKIRGQVSGVSTPKTVTRKPSVKTLKKTVEKEARSTGRIKDLEKELARSKKEVEKLMKRIEKLQRKLQGG